MPVISWRENKILCYWSQWWQSIAVAEWHLSMRGSFGYDYSLVVADQCCSLLHGTFSTLFAPFLSWWGKEHLNKECLTEQSGEPCVFYLSRRFLSCVVKRENLNHLLLLAVGERSGEMRGWMLFVVYSCSQVSTNYLEMRWCSIDDGMCKTLQELALVIL